MNEVVIGARAFAIEEGKVKDKDQGVMYVCDMPTLTQELIDRLPEIQDIKAYKELLEDFRSRSKEFAEKHPMPIGDVAVITVDTQGGSKIIGPGWAFVSKSPVSAEVALEIEAKATSMEEALDMIENAQGREERGIESTSIEDSRDVKRGNPDNNELTRAQIAARGR
ncbi:MAG: hypothetical protein IJS47_06055 [Clostridia bacterium]|nr:hypothetical protein [Clostridia bacterium]